MTRKEEIEHAAYDFVNTDSITVERFPSSFDYFLKGALWADEHPDEQMIAKYLYEKKGYPIDLNGHLPSFDETMKDIEKYNKYKEDKL